MRRLIDLTGQRFGRLTVVSRAENDRHRNSRWICVCDCGKKKEIHGMSLRRGKTLSCGCLGMEAVTKHGKRNQRIYKVWRSIKDRTGNCNDRRYKNYGGRGIGLIDEWGEFSAFYAWAIRNGYTEELTIDRIDNDKGYYPDNCRWVDMKTQSNNRRTNRNITYNGETKTIAQWAECVGIKASVLYDRISRRKWDIEHALTTPVNKR